MCYCILYQLIFPLLKLSTIKLLLNLSKNYYCSYLSQSSFIKQSCCIYLITVKVHSLKCYFLKHDKLVSTNNCLVWHILVILTQVFMYKVRQSCHWTKLGCVWYFTFHLAILCLKCVMPIHVWTSLDRKNKSVTFGLLIFLIVRKIFYQ